jgi:hypothetical protein
MDKLRDRFPDAFHFVASASTDQKAVSMDFPDCAVASVVQENGQKIGSSVLCLLFHEYWAGLMSAASGNSFGVESVVCEGGCKVQFAVRG